MRKESNYIDFRVENIKRVNFFIPECMEHALVSYGLTVGVDFIKAFSHSWEFAIEERKSRENIKIGDCIQKKGDLFDAYEKYNGIRISFVWIENVECLINEIEKNWKKGFPTLIHMDTYYSYWGFLYEKVHSEHVAVVVGIDREKEMVYIVDPDFSDKPFGIKFELLEKASKFYMVLAINNSEKYSYDDLLKLICNEKDEYLKQFDMIELFAIMFQEIFEPQKEFDISDSIDEVLESELISKIRHIIKGRNLFVVFLEQISLQYSDIDKVIEYLYISMGKWNTIMNLMFKGARTGWKNNLNEKISNIIMSIAEIEREAYDVLCQCNKQEDQKKKTVCNHIISMNYVNIDISKYCNNKGFVFGNRKMRQNSDLTNAGEYVELDKKFENISYKGIRFKTYFQNKYDNIICNGQMIQCFEGKIIYSLELLICAEWGRCEDSLILCNEEGKSIVKKIVANDISEINLDNMIQVGKSRNVNGQILNEKVGITYNKIVIESGINLKYIKFPINPNMHIVALSVLTR